MREAEMTRKERKEWTAAIHEAGHAVAIIILGEDFDLVTIVPDEEGTRPGHVDTTQPDDIHEAWISGDRLDNPRVAQWAEHEIIHIYAGSEAQRLFFPRCRWREGHGEVKNMAAEGSDTQTVIGLVADLHGDEKVRSAYHRYCRERARSLVEVHRDKIERVTKALLKNKTLTSGEVRKIMYPEAMALFSLKEKLEARDKAIVK